ncbi:protein prenylyltransferase [Trametes coccinea BRFM310]|uniref:Protein prenylyltransferase n=1 Tax=Trametes coccinea (strain BRFM310) TaxID=1353009 RepID=A0A1Y2IP24_TRAC3|nr:protein prenylyltransferase [Trametes coccinea BRFM310]
MQRDSNPAALSPQLCQRYASLIWSCLDANLHKSALFYAERYFVLDLSNHDARHLYATALLESGQPHSAHRLVHVPAKETRCTGCVNILAKCCMALGRHRQAREALEGCLRDHSYTPTPSMGYRTATAFPDEAILCCQAGNSALKGNLHESAAMSYRQALALNPMLWEAFEGLCAIGDIPLIENLFPPRPQPVRRKPGEEGPSSKSMPIATGAGFFTPDAGSAGNLFRDWKPGFRGMDAPAGLRDSIATSDSSFYGEPSFQAPVRASRSQPANLAVLPPATAAASSRSHVAGKTAPAPPATRRSTRLQSGTGSRLTSKTSTRDRRRAAAKPRSTSTSQSHDSGLEEEPGGMESAFAPTSPIGHSDTSPHPPNPWTAEQELAAEKAYQIELAEYQIYDVMRRFASAARAMALYDCRLCLEELEKLPPQHQRSASVMAMVGKAHYELGQYPAAERAFEAVRILEPYRLSDMEVYSTLLWHLQKNIKLSFLAQELLSTDPKSPQAWIAVGNCFSLQKEKTQALTCFRRAAQLDPTCAYAYTLSGHESIDEDLNKAISFFQSALRADARHYNAWYGLGTCYMRMSKLRLADYHFRRASSIHPQNAVLLGCVGMVQERYQNYEEALRLFNQAIQFSPENALVRYHRAKILIAMKRYTAALEDLQYLRDTSPEESNVLFQLAKVYRLLGEDVKFTQLLAEVRDVAPKSLAKIRKLTENIVKSDSEDVGEEVMDTG